MKNLYLCVTPFFPSPDNWRGAYILDQVKAIARNSDYEVVVFKVGRFKNACDYEVDDVKVHCVSVWHPPSYLFNGITDGINSKIFLRKLKKLGIDAQDITVVHCHTANFAAYGLAVKRKNPDTKVVLQFHDLDPFCVRNGLLHSWNLNQRYRARKSLQYINSVDLNVCISEHVKDALLSFPNLRPGEVYEGALHMYDHLHGFPKAKPKATYVLNNGVDTSIFHPHQKKRDTSAFRIGCIANFWDLKDHQTLVEAFKILHDKGYTNLKLSLIGTGPTRDVIEQYLRVNNLSENVEWPAEVSHEKLCEYYNTLDLFALPSRFEGFGCVYTEAYACGAPFICCQNQGASELIRDDERSLWLVQDRNPQQLAQLIERQYKERNEQQLTKDYNIANLINDYLSYLKTI